MIRAILLGMLALAVGAGAAWWVRARLARQRETRPAESAERPDETGRVVLLAFARNWAERFGSTEDGLRSALLARSDPSLAAWIGGQIGIVAVRFDQVDPSAEVNVTVLVSYRGTGERSTARLRLRWDDVPQGVRAELLAGSRTVVRTWQAQKRE
jgi:hypothetical protein